MMNLAKTNGSRHRDPDIIYTRKEYQEQLHEAINRQNGTHLGLLISVDFYYMPTLNQILDSEPDECQLTQEWYHLSQSHLKVIRLLSQAKYLEAFVEKESIVESFVNIMKQNGAWFLPVIYFFSRDLRQLSVAAEDDVAKRRANTKNEHRIDQDEKPLPKPEVILEKGTECLMTMFRACATDYTKGKRVGMVIITNQLCRLYMKFDKIHLFKPLIRAVESAKVIDYCNLAQRVAFSYFDGVKSVLECNFQHAQERLEFVFENCHPESNKNRYLALVYLIPIKMQYGVMPSEQLLKRYHLVDFYAPIKRALLAGRIDEFFECLMSNHSFFCKYGVFNLLETLRTLCYRNLFKRVALTLNTNFIPISTIKVALSMVSSKDWTHEDIYCILSSHIHSGKLKGYISINHEMLVISKVDPFPKKENLRKEPSNNF